MPWEDDIFGLIPEGTLARARRAALARQGTAANPRYNTPFERAMIELGRRANFQETKEAGLQTPDIDPIDFIAAPGLQALGSKAARTYLQKTGLPLSNRWLYAKNIPQFGEALEQGTRPAASSWQRIKDLVQDTIPQGGAWEPALAPAQKNPAWQGVFEEALPNSLTGKWDLTVPYFSTDPRYPLVAGGKDVGRLFDRMGLTPFGEHTAGLFDVIADPKDPRRYVKDIVGIRSDDPLQVLGHETKAHMGPARIRGGYPWRPEVTQSLPVEDIAADRALFARLHGDITAQEAPLALEQAQAMMPELNPKHAEYLEALGYKGGPRFVGEEMMGRSMMNEPGGQGTFWPGMNTRQALESVGQRHIHPSLLREYPTGLWPSIVEDAALAWLKKYPESRRQYLDLAAQEKAPGYIDESWELMTPRENVPDAGYFRAKWSPEQQKFLTDVISVRQPYRRQGIADDLLTRAKELLGYIPPPEEITAGGTPFWAKWGFYPND